MIPECEQDNNQYLTPWLNLSIPVIANLPEKCTRFTYTANETHSCNAESFNRSMTVGCDAFVYEDDEVTIQNQVRACCSYQVS